MRVQYQGFLDGVISSFSKKQQTQLRRSSKAASYDIITLPELCFLLSNDFVFNSIFGPKSGI